jgi:hypothetical protein
VEIGAVNVGWNKATNLKQMLGRFEQVVGESAAGELRPGALR